MGESAAWPLERYIPLLRFHARHVRLQLGDGLRQLLEVSDLVSETMLRAFKGYPDFKEKGMDAAEKKWLRVILANVCKDKIDWFNAQKNPIKHEVSIQNLVARSSARLDAFLADHQPSPSERAEREEALLRLAAAIDRLPEAQRDAVMLCEIEELPVAEVARRLKRTEKSVAGLLMRGKARLCELLEEPGGGAHDA